MADNLDPETLRQLNESMREMRETVAGMVPAMVLMTAAMNENMNATRGNANTTKNGKKLVDDFLKSQQEATAVTHARAKADEEYAKVQANYTKAKEQGVESLKKFGNGLLTAGGDMTKYGGAVSSAGDAAMSIGKNFGVLGLAIGGLIKLFSMGAEMVLKQNAAMLKSADILADFGATGALTTTELLAMANAAGYSSGEMEKFAGITKGLGTDIIGLSATVTGGVKAFAELATMDETLLANYRAMGVTQEQLNKNQADYIKLQIRSGVAISERDKQDGTLKRTTLEYTNYLMDLSAITGLSVDEAKKAQEVARADLAVQTRLALLQDKEEKLRSRGLAEGNKEMIAQADAVKAERERTGALMDMAGTMLKGEELAGFQSMVATGNFNELSAGFASGAPEILEFIDAVKKGKKEPYELSLMMAQATKRTRENLGEAVIQNKEVGKSFAYSLEALQNEAKFRGKNPEEIKKIIEEERAVRAKALKEGTTDPAKAARNAQEQAERRTRLGADAIVGLLNGPVTSAFEKLMKVMSGVMKGMAIYSDKLFGTDLAKLFETPEEIADKAHKNALALEEVTRKIEQTKKSMQQPEAYKEELLKEKKLAEDNYILKAQETEKTRELYNKEQDTAKKAILKQQLIENQKEEQAAKQLADQANLNIKNAKFSMSKEKADEKLLELEKQRNILTSEGNTLDERFIKKQLELGEITPQEAAVMRKNTAGAVRSDNQRANTSSSAREAESAGTQSSAESRRLGMTKAMSPQQAAGPIDSNLLKKLSESGITDTKSQANILAQIQAESGGKAKSESLNYTPKRLLEMFPKKFKDMEDAKSTVAGGEEAIGNRIYGGRMGNTADEGYKYRGRGLIQLTGKDNYAKFGKMLGIDLVGNPDLANDPDIAQQLAIAYFKEKQKAGINLSDSRQVSKAVGHVDIGGEESGRRELLAQNILDKLPQAAEGGIFSGANTGYPVAMHGNELVAPLDPNSVIAKMLMSTPDQMMQSLNNTTVADNSSPENNGLTLEVFTMLAEKLDTMITILSTSNDTQEQLLKYSRV
jgi:predicted chitinase